MGFVTCKVFELHGHAHGDADSHGVCKVLSCWASSFGADARPLPRPLAADSFHGPFAFVLSLTRWEERAFTGAGPGVGSDQPGAVGAAPSLRAGSERPQGCAVAPPSPLQRPSPALAQPIARARQGTLRMRTYADLLSHTWFLQVGRR
jgi:hypothetical protein